MPLYKFTDRFGTQIGLRGDQPPSEDVVERFFNEHYESQRTVGGQAEEFAKAIP